MHRGEEIQGDHLEGEVRIEESGPLGIPALNSRREALRWGAGPGPGLGLGLGLGPGPGLGLDLGSTGPPPPRRVSTWSW